MYSSSYCVHLFSPPGDSLTYHNNAPFSTWDHDATQAKCASKRHGAWWFKWCLNSNLNGMYGPGTGYEYMMWMHWLGMEGMKSTEMKIRLATYHGQLGVWLPCKSGPSIGLLGTCL